MWIVIYFTQQSVIRNLVCHTFWTMKRMLRKIPGLLGSALEGQNVSHGLAPVGAWSGQHFKLIISLTVSPQQPIVARCITHIPLYKPVQRNKTYCIPQPQLTNSWGFGFKLTNNFFKYLYVVWYSRNKCNCIYSLVIGNFLNIGELY